MLSFASGAPPVGFFRAGMSRGTVQAGRNSVKGGYTAGMVPQGVCEANCAKTSATGLARSLAVVAASPAVEGVVLTADALIDLGTPLWARPSGRAPFTAVLLGRSDIPDLPLDPPRDPVRFLSATPVTATEAAWVRLKGADAMRDAWQSDGVDVLNPNRPAAQPN